jgi:hypothetical protein
MDELDRRDSEKKAAKTKKLSNFTRNSVDVSGEIWQWRWKEKLHDPASLSQKPKIRDSKLSTKLPIIDVALM